MRSANKTVLSIYRFGLEGKRSNPVFLAFWSFYPNTEGAGLSASYRYGQELFEQYCKFMNRFSSLLIPGKDMCRH